MTNELFIKTVFTQDRWVYKRLINALVAIQCLKEQFEALHARNCALGLHSNNTTTGCPGDTTLRDKS